MHEETAIVCAARFYMRRLQGLTCMYNKKNMDTMRLCIRLAEQVPRSLALNS